MNFPFRHLAYKTAETDKAALPDEQYVIFFADLLKQAKQQEQRFILCSAGLIGSGKSTVMGAVANRLNLAYIRTDSIRWLLLDSGYTQSRTNELAAHLTATLLEDGYAIAIDADAVQQDRQHTIERLASDYAAKVLYIHVQTPDDVILQRLHKDNPNRRYKGGEVIEHYHQRKPLHDDLSHIKFTATVDGAGDLDAEVDAVVHAIQSSLGK